MPRKAALIAEQSIEPAVPESPLRRSTRTRVTNSPAPTAAISRTRRSSTSSIDSVISVSSTASLPTANKGTIRTRRPSLSQESALEKIDEKEVSAEVSTSVKRTRRGSISSLQDDATVRAGSPAVAPISVTDRRRSLRSASRSPTSESKSTNESAAATNGTPVKIRGRRTSAEKTVPKRRGSITLDVLDEENEAPETPKKQKVTKKDKLPIVTEEDATEETTSDSNSKVDERKRFSGSSESSTKTRRSSENKPASEDTSKVLSIHQKMRDQIMSKTTVVISPLTRKISSDKLSEITEIIYDIEIPKTDLTITDIQPLDQNKSIDLDEEMSSLQPEVLPVKKTLEEVKMSPQSSPKRVKSHSPSPKHVKSHSPSPIRRSPRLNSETGSETGSDSPSRKIHLISPQNHSPIIGRTASFNSPKAISISKENTPTKEATIEKKALSFDDSKEMIDGSDGSFHLSLKSSILSSQEGLNKSTKDQSDESDKENTSAVKTTPAKRVSNVFSAKNVEESFFEAMDVDYPTDNDDSLSVEKEKRASMNKTVAAIVVNTVTDESSSGSLNLVTSDDSEGKKSDDSMLKTMEITKNRQSIALIQLDKSAIINDLPPKNADNDAPNTLFDSRISILPSQVLMPLNAQSTKEIEIELEIENPKENNASNPVILLDNSPKEKDSHKIATNLEDTATFAFSDDESDEIIAENEVYKSEKSPIKPDKAIFAFSDDESDEIIAENEVNKLKKSPIKLAEENKRGAVKNSEENDINVALTDEEKEISDEEEAATKLQDLILAESHDSSDTEYQPNLDEIKEPIDEYDSCPDNKTDDESDTDNVFKNSNNSPKIKTFAPTKRILELQSITIKSSDSDEDKDAASMKMKQLQSITIKSSSSSDESDSKLLQLILNKTAEYNEDTDSSDSDFKPNEFLDNEAMEGSDEETPSEGSNDIIDVGDNIEDTDDELEHEEEVYESDDDFIDDNEAVELLSGNEDDNDLNYDGKQKIRKRGRILIRPADESDEEVPIPNTINEIVPKEVVEENNAKLDTSVTKSKKKRTTSFSTTETLKKDKVDSTEVAEKIGGLVDIFCSRIIGDKTGGNVTLNMSLDYEGSSSNDEEKPKVVLNTSEIKKLQKRKSLETAAACDSSTSKIKVLQEIRISGDLKDDKQIELPPSAKKSKKMLKKQLETEKNKSHIDDDDVFLPDSSCLDNSEHVLTTPRPSNVCSLPDNIISQLVEEEATTSKHNAKHNKKFERPIGLKLRSEELQKYSKPSASHGNTSDWKVYELKKNTKPSTSNIKGPKVDVNDLIDPKDFKNYMIAKNKPKISKKSFKDTLKTQRKL